MLDGRALVRDRSPHARGGADRGGAQALTIPALLVRGGSSELVPEAHVREFLALVPHAEYHRRRGARHMVAGDSDDSFADAVLDFVGKLEGSSAGA